MRKSNTELGRALAIAGALLALATINGCQCGGPLSEMGQDRSGLVGNQQVGPGPNGTRKHYTEGLRPEPDPLFKLPVGAECTQYKGNSACQSGLCLRVTPGSPAAHLRPKGFCSVRCSNYDRRCPDGWKCTQAYPSNDGWVCAPAKTWTSAEATHQGGPVPLPPPQQRHGLDAGFGSHP